MLNQQSINAVKTGIFDNERFLAPHESYCFSHIPGTIARLLSAQYETYLPDGCVSDTSQQVLFLFIDSFGWKFFNENSNNYPFLQRFVTNGIVSQLTSQFPSTTAAHVTTIHTGLPVGLSGIYEWTYWEPKINMLINPLLFAQAVGKSIKGSLHDFNVTPESLFPTNTFYQQLAQEQIVSHVFQFHSYTPSEYSDIVFNGAIVHPYPTFVRGLVELGETIQTTQGKAYYFFYYDSIDSAGHVGGPGSVLHKAEIHNVLTMLEDILMNALKGKQNLTILMSADHGMASVNPSTCTFLDKEPYYPEITDATEHYKNKPIIPMGSPRDMFLKIKKERVNDIHELLAQKLQGKAAVFKTNDLIEKGFFGRTTEEFRKKVGSIVVTPFNHEAVWYSGNGAFPMTYFGHHGGLTPDEMEIPFLFLRL